MSGSVRPPAPTCRREDCAEPAEWSETSRRYLKYCSDRCRIPAARGTCRKGLHPRPAPGERCKGCKADWIAQHRSGVGNGRQPVPGRLSRRSREPVPAAPTGPWRPAGIDRYPARGGPGDGTQRGEEN